MKENIRTTVIRFDHTCTVELKLSGERVTVKVYNEVDGSEKQLTGKLKERSKANG